MPLHIFSSDKIDRLAAKLKEKIQEHRKKCDDPFIFTDIAVPNTNLGKWLQMKIFSKNSDLCAGIRFPFIDSCLSSLLLENLPEDTKIRPMPDNAFRFAIMKILLSDPNPALAPFRNYIANGGEINFAEERQCLMAWQLTEKLADLVDTYEVNRPELIDKWLGEEYAATAENDQIVKAEIALIRALFGKDGFFPEEGDTLTLRQIFKRVKNNPNPVNETRTLFIFGHSILTPLQAEILLWLSQYHNIYFFHFDVCLEYWGDIEKLKAKLKKYDAEDNQTNSDIENALLQTWGFAGRHTIRLLVDIEEKSAYDHIINWETLDESQADEGTTLLEKVQASIRHRTSEIEKAPKQDESLQIIGAPGVRREVEMIHNDILRLVDSKNSNAIAFNDIAILVPDMATYRPFIEAVFDSRRPQIPYGLIDTSASEESIALRGLESLFELRFKGFNRDRLFAVLDNPMVQRALSITSEMVVNWRDLTSKLKAFDFYDATEMEQAGICIGRYNTWAESMKRLRLGMITDIHMLKNQGDDDALRLSETIELLYAELKQAFPDVAEKRTWGDAINQLTDAFLQAAPDDDMEKGILNHIKLLTKALDKQLADNKCEQPLAFTRAAISQLVGGISCRHGNYLTDGVTIAGLKPMRPVPFKHVYVLGLGEGLFPGNSKEESLNLKDLGQKTKSPSVPDINRFLFLETLMATQKRMVLSYVNRNLEGDAEMFPSSIISTLKDFLPNILEGKFRELKLPLLESDSPHFGHVSSDNLDAPLTTYSPTAWRIARKAPTEAAKQTPLDNQSDYDPSAKDLAEFLKNPMRAVMKQRFRIPVEGYQDTNIKSELPLEAGWHDTDPILKDLMENPPQDNETAFEEFQQNGTLPDGYYGTRQARILQGSLDALRTDYQNLPPDTEKIFGSFDDKATLPPECTLPDLIAWLMSLDATDPSEKTFTIAIFKSGDKAGHAEWQWSVSGTDAADYITNLKERFREYLEHPSQDNTYLSMSYKNLADAISKTQSVPIDFNDVLNKLENQTDYQRQNANSFNNELVVQKILDEFIEKLPASANELKDLYEAIYKLPMSGKKK